MIKDKSSTVDIIIAIAAGRKFIPAPSEENREFVLIDRNKQLFRNTHTGKELTFIQIQKEIIGNPKKVIVWCEIKTYADNPDYVYLATLTIMPRDNDKVYFIDGDIEYSDSIHINIEEYMKSQEAKEI